MGADLQALNLLDHEDLPAHWRENDSTQRITLCSQEMGVGPNTPNHEGQVYLVIGGRSLLLIRMSLS